MKTLLNFCLNKILNKKIVICGIKWNLNAFQSQLIMTHKYKVLKITTNLHLFQNIFIYSFPLGKLSLRSIFRFI